MTIFYIGALAIKITGLGIFLVLCCAFGGGVSVVTKVIRKD